MAATFPNFTPAAAAAGGAILALSASFLLHQTGRWTGCSSVFKRAVEHLLGRPEAGHTWELTWLGGAMSALLVAQHSGVALLQDAAAPSKAPALSAVLTAVSAMIIGVGAHVGSGCTSGHGVMGVPRLSLRSIVATSTFMTTGVLAATYLAPLLPAIGGPLPQFAALTAAGPWVSAAAGLAILFADAQRHARAAVVTYGCGLAFGLGLLLSGMVDPSKLIGFLDIRPLLGGKPLSDWDPSMLMVMVAAIATNFIAFQALIPGGTAKHHSQAAAIPGFFNSLPTASKVTPNLVAGAALFGVGWGLSGVCVGPAATNIARGSFDGLLAAAGIAVGAQLASAAGF